MALIRSLTDTFQPDYGLIVVCDAGGPAVAAMPAAIRGYNPTPEAPAGTLAIGGAGWLGLSATGEDQQVEVEVEVYDGPPPPDDQWDDLQTIPYFCQTGAVRIDTLIGRADAESVELAAGQHSVRVCRHRTTWRLQLWPSATPVEPPRWLARGRSAVNAWDGGWQSVLGSDAIDLSTAVHLASAGGGVTVEQLDRWCAGDVRGPAWLDDPLTPEPPFPPDRLTLPEIAEQLGQPVPTRRRDLLGVLVMAGLLTLDHRTGRYDRAEAALPADEVLSLPPSQRDQLIGMAGYSRYGELTADLICLAAWSTPRHETTLGELADRLLARPDEVLHALRYGVQERLLNSDDTPETPDPVRTVSLTYRPFFI